MPQDPEYSGFLGSTSAAARVLQPWQYSDMPKGGVVIGYELEMRRPVGLDFYGWQREGRINNRLVGVFAKIKHGKTLLLQTIAARHAPLKAPGSDVFRIGYDCFKHNGIAPPVPETEKLARKLNSRLIKLVGDFQINPLDRAFGLVAEEQVGISKSMLMSRGGDMSPRREKVLDICVRRNMLLPEPSFVTLTKGFLDWDYGVVREYLTSKGYYGDALKEEATALMSEARELFYLGDNLLSTEFGSLFAGTTSSLYDMFHQQFVSIDFVGVASEDVVSLIEILVGQWRASKTFRSNPDLATHLEFHDENHSRWANLEYARRQYMNQKTIRMGPTIQILASHHLTDYSAVGPAGSEQRAKATNMLKDIGVWFIGNQPRSAHDSVVEFVPQMEPVIGTTATLQPGQFYMVLGSETPKLIQVALTKEELQLFDTEVANKAMDEGELPDAEWA